MPDVGAVTVKVHVDLSEIDEAIRRVEILTVQPGDLVVLKVDEGLSEQQVIEVKRMWIAATGIDRVVVLAGIEVQVVRDAPAG